MRIETTGSNIRRALSLVSANAYDKEAPQTIGKESLQNALDAVQGLPDPKVEVGSAGSFYRIRDNGPGMSPRQVLTEFLRGFTSGKDGTQTAGSFGLAKVALLGAPSKWYLATIQNGTRTTVHGEKGQWLEYAQADTVSVDLDVSEHTLPGGLLLKMEPTSEPDGTEYWAEIEGAEQAEATARRTLQLYRSEKLRYRLADPSGWLEPGPASDDRKPDVAETPALGIPRRTETVDGATVSLFYNHDPRPVKQSSVAVTNRGMLQFHEWIGGLDAALPADLSIDVTPTVTPDSQDYPFTLSRDGLKGPAKTLVHGWLQKMAEESKKLEADKLRQVKDSARRLRGSHLKFLDMTGSLPEALLEQIVNSAPLSEYAKAVRKAYDEAAEQLGPDYACEFQGLAFGDGTLAVHCARQIWFFPFAMETFAGRDGLTHPELAAGAFVHELAHCKTPYEGESHAREMTFLAGRVSETTSNLKRALRRVFERQSGFADWLRNTAEKVREFEDADKVRLVTTASK